jgi:hypothetical protein
MTKEQFWYEFPRNMDRWRNNEVAVIDGRYETHLSMIPFEVNPDAMGMVFNVKLPGYDIMRLISQYCLNRENPDNVMMQLWNMSNDLFDTIRRYKTEVDEGVTQSQNRFKTLDEYLQSNEYKTDIEQKASWMNCFYETSMNSAYKAFEAFEAQQ